LIFSKAATGRFPADGEVEELIANLKTSGETPVSKTSTSELHDEKKQNAGAGMLRRLSDRFRN